MKSIILLLCVSITSFSIEASECEFVEGNYTPEQIQFYNVFKNILDDGGRYTMADCGEVIVHSIKSSNLGYCLTIITVEYIIKGEKIPEQRYFIRNFNDGASVSMSPEYIEHPLTISEDGMKYDLTVGPSYSVIAYIKHQQQIKFNQQGLINSIKYKGRLYLIPLPLPVERVNLSCKL